MAANPALLPEIVRDFRLEATTFQDDITIHTQPPGRRRRIEKWKRRKILGHGGYGVVWLEHKVENDDNAEVARRAVKVVRNNGHGPIHYVRELEALAKFSHDRYSECFVKFLGWYENPESDYIHIAMEYCPHGDLKKFLARNGGRLPEIEVRDIASQVLGGVVMMHRAGFANRDIKPANILIKSKPPSGWWVKICDFGLSKRAVGDFASDTTTVRGTPDFMPPEILGFSANPSGSDWFMVDMWCLGETVFQALTGQPVFGTPAAVGSYFKGRLGFPAQVLHSLNVSTQAESFIISLMEAWPPHRMTSETAIKHPWVLNMTLEKGIHVPEARDTEAKDSEGSYRYPFPQSKAPGDQLTEASGEWTTSMTLQSKLPPQHQAALHPHNLRTVSDAQSVLSPYNNPTSSSSGYFERNHSPFSHDSSPSLETLVTHTTLPTIRSSPFAKKLVHRKSQFFDAEQYLVPSHPNTTQTPVGTNLGDHNYHRLSYSTPTIAWPLPCNDEETADARSQLVEPTEMMYSSSEDEAKLEEMGAFAEQQQLIGQQRTEWERLFRNLKRFSETFKLLPLPDAEETRVMEDVKLAEEGQKLPIEIATADVPRWRGAPRRRIRRNKPEPSRGLSALAPHPLNR